MKVINFINKVFVFHIDIFLWNAYSLQWMFVWVPFTGKFCFSIPLVDVGKSHSLSLCLLSVTDYKCLIHFCLLNTACTLTTISMNCLSDLKPVFLGVWFQQTFVLTYVVDGKDLWFPTIVYHFCAPRPLSIGNLTTTAANFMSIHIL